MHKGPSADEVEFAWRRLADTSEFIPEGVAKAFERDLRKQRRRSAFKDALHGFAKGTCPTCGERGYFRVRALGECRHGGCPSWRLKPGDYLGHVAGEAVRLAPTLVALPLQALLSLNKEPGKPAPPPPPKGPLCPGCGSPFEENRAFCPTCGRRRTG